MSGKKTAVEVHKFGGASLGDGAAFRHAVTIVQGRRAAPVVVVSAPAGITDVLLGLATRAVAGDRSERPALERDVEALRKRYHAVATEAVGARAGKVGKPGKPGKAAGGVAAEIDRSIDELAALLSSLAALKELTPRTRDFIVSRGERLSAQIFAAALAAAGTPSAYVDATDVVFTDGPFGGASPNLPLTDLAVRKKLQPLIAAGKVPVVPGFIGSANIEDENGAALEERAVATLGRGGSDLTASLLGRALAATEVSLWKDVSGLLTADPRVVPDARVIPQLHLREAAELAYYGAKVLHPRALIPIAGRPVPVFVRPFADPGAAGTEISARRTLDKYPVKALSAAGGQALITVGGNGMLGVPGIAARTFESLHREGISVSLISQSSSEQSICFSVPSAAGKRARTRLLEEFHDEIGRKDIDGIDVQDGLATVAVVGLGMAGHRGIASRVFGALAEAGINIVAIAQGSSELNISFVVAAQDAAPAQRAVHAAFQLAKIGGGAATRAEHRDVVLLGFGQIGRALAGIMAKEAKKTVDGKRNGASKLRLTAAIDTSGFVFEPGGLTARAVGELAESKQAGHSLAETRAGRRANPADALTVVSQHALANPILVDLTAADTTALVLKAVDAGMDVVLANKRPLAGPRKRSEELWQKVADANQRMLTEATVGAGLPIFDTYRKLVESGDRVLKIEGCLSGTLGFVMTEVERGRPFSEAVRRAMEKGYTEPDPRDDLSGTDVGRKGLILGRLLGFAGEPEDVGVESLVPAALRGIARDAFVARLAEMDAEWARRAVAAKAKGSTLRYVASVSKDKIAVGLQTVSRSSPFFGLKGTDNQVAFTTARYRKNPLVITGPGAGPAVTAAGVLNDLLRLT